MIALFAASALAGPHVDALYDYQWQRTSPIVVSSDTGQGGQAVEVPVDPERTALDSGVAVEVSWGGLYLLSFGLRGYDAHYDVSGFEFDPQVWDVRADFGGYKWFGWRGEPTIDGYVVGAAGVQATVLSAQPWPTTIAPALHTFGGLGIANRKGPVRIRVEGRLSFGVRADAFEGRAELPEEAIVWRFRPGSATASLLFGIGFGG